MISIRHCRETDAKAVGILIADTFSTFNLSFASPVNRKLLSGPFQHARSQDSAHRQAIAQVIRSAMVFVAEDGDEIVGVLRGRTHRLGSLFVSGDHHRRGIGRRLVEHFEQACRNQGATTIRVAATLYAVPFYIKMGYKRSTGIRSGWCFEGSGFRYQPMKKVLRRA